MGYTTYFDGSFALEKPLTKEHRDYLVAFNDTRRMRRNGKEATKLPDPIRFAVGLPIGTDGAYFVGGTGHAGQDHDESIDNYNDPPDGQPGLWCQWRPNEDGTAIEWDEGEKFYAYTEWLKYLIEHFLKPWGYVLNGDVTWAGADPSDLGMIVVRDNVVTEQAGRIVYG